MSINTSATNKYRHVSIYKEKLPRISMEKYFSTHPELKPRSPVDMVINNTFEETFMDKVCKHANEVVRDEEVIDLLIKYIKMQGDN